MLPCLGCKNATCALSELDNINHSLVKHIRELSENIGERNMRNPKTYENLTKAATYIKDQLRDIGYTVNIQEYIAKYETQEFIAQNIEVVIEGVHSSHSDPYTVIGAHYDTVDGSPGADDNASGIAALLEIARYLFNIKHLIKRTIKLVAFPNEERPYSVGPDTTNAHGNNMGSVRYAKTAKARGDIIDGMICLESIGYYSNEPGSQCYPEFLNKSKLPPDRGNYLACISDENSKPFLDEFVASYEKHTEKFPMYAFSLPQGTPDIGRSDHKSFWLQSYPALMLTDSADLRNHNYHKESDTLGSINFNSFTEVTKSLCSAIENLACKDHTAQKILKADNHYKSR